MENNIMKIDKKLQKECYNKAIKKVAANRDTTQKHVKEILGRTYNLDTPMLSVKYAVENWTIEYYNREMQARYL